MHRAKTKTKTNKQKRMHRADRSILWKDWLLPLSRQPAHSQGSDTKPSIKDYQKTQKVTSLGLSRTTYSVAGGQCLWETQLGNMTWEWQVRDVCSWDRSSEDSSRENSKQITSLFIPTVFISFSPCPSPHHASEREWKEWINGTAQKTATPRLALTDFYSKTRSTNEITNKPTLACCLFV